MNDTNVDLAATREPEIRSTPTGAAYAAPTFANAGAGLADVLFFPFSAPTIFRRLTNPGEQSAALGSVVTNNSDTFLSGFKREVGSTVDDVTESAKTVAKTVGGIVGSLLPWWLWALLGLGITAYLVTILLPYLKKPA